MLIGGATVELDNGREVRGVFHMLLIGDASTGKSTLLREAKLIARGRSSRTARAQPRPG